MTWNKLPYLTDVHAAITIHADLNTNLLALAAQELDLDTQVANRVFAGPAAAGPSKPTFRSMVAADLPVEAIVDADFAAGEGFMRKTGAGTYVAHKSNLASAANPGVNNDAAAGYSVGSVWINTTLDVVWQCVDSTNGNAVWKDLSTAVTLDANADTILSLSTQALGLDVQVANKVFSGPRDGLAAKFVAADARYLTHADDAALSVGDIYWDMVVWVKVGTPANTQGVIFKGVDILPCNFEYYLLIINQKFYFEVRDIAHTVNKDVSANNFGIITADTWCMVHVYHDPVANVIGIDVNAGIPNTTATSGGVRDSVGNFQTGRTYYNATGYHLDGAVGPVAIWKPTGTNLTAAQLTWLYNGRYGRNFTEIGRQDDGQYLGPVAGLQTWWQMDEITGTRAPTFSTLLLTEVGGAVSSEAGISSGPVVPGFRVLIDSDLPRKSNLAAVAAPAVGDDCVDGYTVGSVWINIVTGTVYQCVNATAGAAVWKDLSTVGTKIVDADADTKVDVEEGADDDTVRIDLGGGAPVADAIIMTAAGGLISKISIIPNADSAIDLGSSAPKYFANVYVDKLWLNSTAALDGVTAGRVTVTGDFYVPGRCYVGPAMGGYAHLAVAGDLDTTIMTLAINASVTSIHAGGGILPTVGIYGGATAEGTPASCSVYGLYFQATYNSASACSTVTGIRIQACSAAAGVGVLTQAIGIDIAASNWGGSKPVTSTGLYVDNQGNAATTTAYGIRVINQTAGTNIYNLEIEGAGVTYLRVVGGAVPAAGLTHLWLYEGTTPALRNVAFVNTDATGHVTPGAVKKVLYLV